MNKQGIRVTWSGGSRVVRRYPRVRRYGRDLSQYGPDVTNRRCLFCGLRDCYGPGGCEPSFELQEEVGND